MTKRVAFCKDVCYNKDVYNTDIRRHFMKIGELDFSQYEYKRISVITAHGAAYFCTGAEETVKKEFGEQTLADENGVQVTESGWLILNPVKES